MKKNYKNQKEKDSKLKKIKLKLIDISNYYLNKETL